MSPEPNSKPKRRSAGTKRRTAEEKLAAKAAREKAAREKAAEKERKAKEREAAAKAKKEQAAREKERKAKEREAAAKAKKEQAAREKERKAKEREAAAKAKKEQAARERERKAKEREAAAKARKEQAARERAARKAQRSPAKRKRAPEKRVDTKPPEPITLDSIAQQIREAYLQATHGAVKERVLLKDLRPRVGVQRADFDEALLAMQRQSKVVLMGLDNPMERTPEVEAAALHIAGHPRHLVYFQG